LANLPKLEKNAKSAFVPRVKKNPFKPIGDLSMAEQPMVAEPRKSYKVSASSISPKNGPLHEDY
jgi:hypothetical protein